jgi:hypothetical protein
MRAGLRWRATLRRSSHRATGGNSEKNLAKTIGEAKLFSGGCYDGAYQPSSASPTAMPFPVRDVKVDEELNVSVPLDIRRSAFSKS